MIRVVAEVGDKRVPMLWVVMMDKPEDALAAVRFYLAPGCDVELTDYRISAETIRALALVPNQVKQPMTRRLKRPRDPAQLAKLIGEAERDNSN